MSSTERPGFWTRAAQYLGFTAEEQPSPALVREGVVPPARPDIATVTPDSALTIGAVYRSVQIIVNSIVQMEMGVERHGREMTTPAIIRTPDVNQSQAAFVEETVYALATEGQAFWRLYRPDAQSVPSSIKVLDPNFVSFTEDPETHKVSYFVEGREMAPHQIKHLKLMRRPGRARGLGPIQAATSELTFALKLRAFCDNWFDTSGVPTGYLSTEQRLSGQEAQEFAKAWKRFLKDHGFGVLSQGLDWKTVALKPAEAQFLEVQKATVVAIARLFGIPTTYLLAEMEGTSNTYVNQQEVNLIYLQFTLSKYMTEIESALSDLLPRGQRVQFNEAQLLRMNSQLKTDIQAKQVKYGLRSADELRAEDGLEPLPEPAPVPDTPAEGDAA